MDRQERRGGDLPPRLLQLIEGVPGVILGWAWAQDLVVLLRSCQPTFCTAVHHLLGGVQVSPQDLGYPPHLTAFFHNSLEQGLSENQTGCSKACT